MRPTSMLGLCHCFPTSVGLLHASEALTSPNISKEEAWCLYNNECPNYSSHIQWIDASCLLLPPNFVSFCATPLSLPRWLTGETQIPIMPMPCRHHWWAQIWLNEEVSGHTSFQCDTAAACGSLKALQFLWSIGSDWSRQTCSSAAFHGDLDMLKRA